GPCWTIFSTSSRILRRSMSRFLRTLAATPDPSLTRPRRMCSVPMYSWLSRIASWFASCITLRARSVNRSYIVAASSDVPSKAKGARVSVPRLAPPHVTTSPDLSMASADQFLRLRRLEEEPFLARLVLAHLDGDPILADERAAQQIFRQRIFQQMLDRPAQRTRPILGTVALLDDEFLRLGVQH